MKKYVFFLFSSFLMSCGQTNVIPEVIEEPSDEPEILCGCCNVEPIEDYLWYQELTVWNYPYKQNKSTIEDWIVFSQIPEEVLYSITTEDLIEICIQYPLGIYLWIISFQCPDLELKCIDWTVNMDYIIYNFNGLSELYKREDACYKLIKRYDEIVDNIYAICSKSRGNLMIYADLELLLGSYQTNDKTDSETYKEILRHLMNGYHAKLLFPEIFSSLSLNPNFIARAMIIEKINPNSLLSKIELPFRPPGMEEILLINELSYALTN